MPPSLFVERLEDAGRYQGNGHHFAQNLAQEAVDRLKRNWIEPKIIVTDQNNEDKTKGLTSIPRCGILYVNRESRGDSRFLTVSPFFLGRPGRRRLLDHFILFFEFYE